MTKHLLRAAFLALLVSACSDEEPAAPVGPSTQDPLLPRIAAAGFQTEGIRDLGDSFVVEGDIVLRKSEVAGWSISPAQAAPGGIPGPRFQWHTTNLVGQTPVYGLKVDLSGLGSFLDWQAQARQALADWNAINGSAVYLVEGSPADITISAGYNSDCGVAALASWPANGQPGPTITVNTNYCGSPNNSSTRRRNMVHEIGHTLGFRHSNWQGYSCGQYVVESASPIGAVQVPGTPATDAASVMNGCTAGASWTGFSANDQLAVRTLYPRAASAAFEGQPMVRVIGYWAPTPPFVNAFTSGGALIPGKRAQSYSVDDPSLASISPSQLAGLQPGHTTVRGSVDGIPISAGLDVIAITITGPSTLGWNEVGTYTATITGPGGPYTPAIWTSGEATSYCAGQLTCTLTGSQLGETYVQFFVRDERTGYHYTNVMYVNL
jgi:hypothetical protein